MRTAYHTAEGPGAPVVSTEYSGWSVINGQAYPGAIVRKENGAAVFTFKISGAVVGPAPQDGIFTTP